MNRSARLKQLAGQSFVYGLGGLVSRAVGIVLLPVYFRHVSRVQFGDVELIMSTITLAAILFRLGLTNAMFRFSFDRAGDEARRETIQTTFTATLVLSTLAVVLGLIFLNPLASVLGGKTLTIIGLTGLWVSMNFDIVTGIYRIERRPSAFVVYSLINVAITVVMTILLVVYTHHEAAGLMIGNFSGTYITYVLMVIARRDMVGFRLFDRELLKRMLHFSVPLIPAGLALWALNVADRFQVKYLGSPELLGSYSAASKIALSIMLLIAAFQTAWPAFANSMPTEDETRKVYAVVLTYWSMVMAWAVVAISLVTPPYIHISLPKTVWDAAPVVPLLMFGSVLFGAYLILNAGVNRSKKTRFTPVVTAVAAVVNIGANFLFIPWLGIVGAGITTVLGYIVLVYLGWRNAQHSYPVDYEWSRVIRTALAAAFFIAISVWVVPPAGLLAIVLRAVLILLFPVSLVLIRVVQPGELRRVRSTLKTMGRKRSKEAVIEAEEEEAIEEEPVA